MLATSSFPAPATVFARLLNKLLQREDWARVRLSQHAGKTVRFVVGKATASLSIASSGYTQVSDPAIVPDVTLTIPSDQISKLPGLIRSKDPSALTAILHIQGDAGLAQAVSDLARDLRWDIEHDLATAVGDLAALRILRGGSWFLRTARQSAQRFAGNVGEYLAHESQLLANRQAFTGWTDQLNDMQQRLARLEARTDALNRPAAGRTSTNVGLTRALQENRHV